MIRLVEDIDQIADAYLERLNLCFGGWGDRLRFDWCFRRRTGAAAADVFVAESDDALVAGSATTYRLAQRTGPRPEPVGCMTASWTVRQARGTGLFADLIEQSRIHARRRGCRLLIAFAGAGKASRPGLLQAGAVPVEGAFLTSPGGPSDARPERGSAGIEETIAAFERRRFDDDLSHYLYEAEQWASQMLDRPGSIERRRLASGAIAVIERAGDADRLLDVSCGNGSTFAEGVAEAASVSHASGRRLSAYSLDPDTIAALTARGFSTSPAWLYLMSTDARSLEDERWWFANGDRM